MNFLFSILYSLIIVVSLLLFSFPFSFYVTVPPLKMQININKVTHTLSIVLMLVTIFFDVSYIVIISLNYIDAASMLIRRLVFLWLIIWLVFWGVLARFFLLLSCKSLRFGVVQEITLVDHISEIIFVFFWYLEILN